MALNDKKTYQYMPSPVGPVKLVTRAAARSRFTNETHYRSKDLGAITNLIELTIVEDLSLMVPEGLLVTHHKAIVPAEMISASLMSVPAMKLFKFNLPWNQELRIEKVGDDLVAKIYGIRWQIAGGPPETLVSTLGKVNKDQVFTSQDVSFKLSAGPSDFPTGAVVFVRPRTRRYTLVSTSYTDPETLITTTGWSIGDLRATVAADSTGWITLPRRNSNTGDGESIVAGPSNAEDQQDDGQDAAYALPFGPVAMRGGDGLPAQPVGFNTGPDRTLIHLNYSELPNGTMGVLNQVFEWVGESSSIGAWQRYA
jgi:hypothetical protein